jgi:hypothetical protein
MTNEEQNKTEEAVPQQEPNQDDLAQSNGETSLSEEPVFDDEESEDGVEPETLEDEIDGVESEAL